MIIAIAIMGLLAIFVAASLSRVTAEIRISANEKSIANSYFVAQASLEHMSRNFTQLYKRKISPTSADIADIEGDRPSDFTGNYTINQTLTPVGAAVQTTVGSGSPFAGLNATKTAWLATSDVQITGTDGAKTRLTRTFNNYTIPIFQFGIFFDGDLEFHPGPAFAFGGRVHTNGDLYLAGSNLTFASRVSSHGEVVTDRMRSGYQRPGNWDLNVSIIDGLPSNHMTTLTAAKSSAGAATEGSVIEGPDLLNSDPDRYNGTVNPKWDAIASQFRGNLLARQDRLDLPLTRSPSPDNQGPIELIRRPRGTDDDILTQSRYANQPCLRVTLSDSQAKLPGGGGVRLDGKYDGTGPDNDTNNTQGYWPLQRTAAPTANNPGGGIPVPAAGSRATRVNGFRFRSVIGRQSWIKVEIVVPDPDTGDIVTNDVTSSILSLGVTQLQQVNGAWKDSANIPYGDPNAVIELQRFAIDGPPIKVAPANVFTDLVLPVASRLPEPAGYAAPRANAAYPNTNLYPLRGWATYSYVAGQSIVTTLHRLIGGAYEANESTAPTPPAGGLPWPTVPAAIASPDAPLVLGTFSPRMVPVPTMLFDTREGLYYENLTNANWTALYQTATTTQTVGSSRVPVNGVMSTVNINMANFKRLVNGDFDGTMPGSLTSASFPRNAARGWIVYVSDRRNDVDNDGTYDMEDVYTSTPALTGTLDPGEDVNGSGALEDVVSTVDTDGIPNALTGNGEGATYATSVESDIAALQDTSFYRRSVRVYNGQSLPGDATTGFTLASENGVYVQGNYNATGVANSSGLSAYTDYQGATVPASIVADAITVLSNHWRDGQSFRYPFYAGDTTNGRSGNETTVRAAFLMGNARSAANNAGQPQQAAGKEAHLSGGVHNFKRYIEKWATRFNYCGSLINVFNSRNSNGTYKNGASRTYDPPTTRNWVFDSNFLIPARLPPGTPFFQYLNFTGFRQTYVDSSM